MWGKYFKDFNMVPPTAQKRNLLPSRNKVVSVLLILLVGCIVVIYHQLYDLPFSFNNRPCIDNYKHHQNQKVIRLGTNENLDLTFVEDNLESLDQKNPQLIQYTRVRHLTPPSKQPYNLGNVTNITADNFGKEILQLFGNKRNGVFIEAGANDGGVISSHTLYLEKELGWSGLLVECNPKVVPYLRTKHRKAWVADVCLSPSSHAETFNFSYPTDWTYSGTLGKPWNLKMGSGQAKWAFIDVQAIPLYTLLAGLGWKEVDFFCFDVEGQELAILRNFPFNLFRFKVLIFEEYFTSKEERSELEALLKKNGYVYLKSMAIDKIYVDGEFYKELVAAKKV